MSSACVQGISVRIFVIGNEFVSQTKVDFHCSPWMVAFKSGDIDTLHVITGTHVMDTTAFDGGGVAVCSAFLLIVSYNVLEGNINGVAYLDNVFHAHIVPHFDNHSLADRAIFIDDNVRPHSASIIREFRQKEAIDTFQWPAMSPDINPIDHV